MRPRRACRTSPTVHVIGLGPVGRALLRRCAEAGVRVVAATDSTATVHCSRGLDARAIAAHKADGRALAELAGAGRVPVPLAIGLVSADIVVDAAATRASTPGDAVERGAAALRNAHTALVLASKDGLCAALGDWLADGVRERLFVHAVLGGTGRQLVAELAELRRRTRAFAFAGNASTTAIVGVLEAGGTLEAGLQHARDRGYLEGDPELDLRGDDAAVKLAIVAGALRGAPIDPARIARPDLRRLDPRELRARALRGATTRLIGRLLADGALSLAYEEVARGACLAVPPDRVAYCYELDDGARRTHVGAGVGASAAADAAFEDVSAALQRAGGRR